MFMTQEYLESKVDLCAMFHSGQTDRMGAPYYLHPLRVALEAIKYATDEHEEKKLLLTALFHDVIEDTDVPMDVLFDACDGNAHVLMSIMSLTKPSILKEMDTSFIKKFNILYEYYNILITRPDYTYNEWIDWILEVDDILTMIVKYCDKIDNSLEWRNPKKRNTKYDYSKEKLHNQLFNVHNLAFG